MDQSASATGDRAYFAQRAAEELELSLSATDHEAAEAHRRLQRVVSTSYEHAPPALTRFRIAVAAGRDQVRTVFPDAVEAGRDEFDVTVHSIQQLNAGLYELIANGVLVASVMPERSALEQQFREAVGETQ